jgi:hypothetical protein
VSAVFDEEWRELIVSVLCNFKPYADFIEQVDRRGGIDGDLAFYLALPSKAQGIQANEWGEDRAAKVDNPLKELAAMKRDDWPFFAVFQKALLRTTVNCYRQWDVLAPAGSERTRAAFLKSWLEFLDDLWGRGVLKVRATAEGLSGLVWDGVSLNLGGSHTVQWSDASAARISAQLQLWWYVWISSRQQIRDFVRKLGGKRSNEKWPGGKKAAERLLKGLRRVITAAEDELSPEECAKRENERLVALLTLARVENASGDDEDDDVDDDIEAPQDGAAGDGAIDDGDADGEDDDVEDEDE